MRPPINAVTGNLVWSADGGVWAIWRAEPLAFAHRSASGKLDVHSQLRSMLMALPDQAVLLSACERLDPWALIADMADGLDIEQRPAWRAALDATFDDIEDRPLFRRRHYLACRLPEKTNRERFRAAGAAATAAVARTLGVPPASIDGQRVDAAERQAASIRSRLGSVSLQPVAPGEVQWLIARAARRGVDDPILDESWDPHGSTSAAGNAPRQVTVLAPLTDALFTEGGSSSDEHRPRHRRYLRVETALGVGYQALLALSDMPHNFVFPGGGGEWFHLLDDAPFPVDWCVRMRLVSNAEAQVKARRQARQLVGQFDEYDGEVTGAPASLAEAMVAVDEERAALASSPSEREIQATVVFAVWSTDLDELEDRAGALASMYEPYEYAVARPTGGQLGLFRSMLPGSGSAPVVRDYTQFLLARDLAAGAPCTGSEVGDPTGMLLGGSLDAGVFTPVLFDPAHGPAVNRSASLGACGSLGSGKSYLAKLLTWATVARGGQVVTIDRTSTAEYVRFASVVPGRSQVVTIDSDSGTCLDPLQVFGGADRRRVTLGFLSLLAGTAAQSLEGAALAEAVEVACDRASARLVDVLHALERAGTAGDPHARDVGRKLAHFARLGPARLAFEDGESLSLDADFIVFHAPGMALPDRDTLLNEHLARQMLPEQVFGQALLYLVAAVARSVIFADPARFAAALYDEAWALTASPQGQALLLEGIRDGRKHNAAVWLMSQHPNDLGDSELADLLGPRFVFRQAHGATAGALRFLGVDSSSDSAELLQRGLDVGQCLFRDVADRIGLVQILQAPMPELREAFDTTPHAPIPPQSTRAPEDPSATDSSELGKAPRPVAQRHTRRRSRTHAPDRRA